jgi:poly(A) polymerase
MTAHQKEAAVEIVKRLREHGYTALLAGGCVRDMLLGRTAKDYDVATNAHPDSVTKIFRRTLKIGVQFGVVVVLLGDTQVEVATFRTETGYVDGRHPTHVAFADAREDASRRDFTINGMFYDPIEDKVLDYVGGQADLQRKLIRTIGDARTRFSEDYLRMLRAIRFSTQLGFAIEDKTWRAIGEVAGNITKISGERIALELEATLAHPARGSGAEKLALSGLLANIFAQFTSDEMASGIAVLTKLRKNVNFALALVSLFATVPSEAAVEQIEVLKLSRDQSKHIAFLLAHRGVLLDGDMSIAKLKKLLAKPYFRDLFELQRAFQRARNESIAGLVRIKRRARQLKGQELTPSPLLNGHELIALGAIPGPQVGEVAEELYIEQLSGNIRSSPHAREWVRQWLETHIIEQ